MTILGLSDLQRLSSWVASSGLADSRSYVSSQDAPCPQQGTLLNSLYSCRGEPLQWSLQMNHPEGEFLKDHWHLQFLYTCYGQVAMT